jgi:predicted metal-dependent hydrolase
MIHTILLDGKEVQYHLERKKVKNINLRIKPNSSIYVSANNLISQEKIEKFLNEKSEFILKALEHYREIEKYAPKPKQYIDGEHFKICGHDLRLKVFKGAKNYVESDGVYIKLTVKDINDFELKQKSMDKWIKEQCVSTISMVCEAVYPKFQKYGIVFPELKFRRMISRWGSCQPKRGTLTFNISLIEAPMACIEYVVVHEFTHFMQPNHSKKFYTQLTMFMPDWLERKKLLEKCGIGIL